MAAQNKRTAARPIQSYSRAQLKSAAEQIAQSALGTGAQEAFNRLDDGDLNGTMAGVELTIIRDALKGRDT